MQMQKPTDNHASIGHKQTICFSLNDLELFSAASHDRSPLHMSKDYARQTPYGDQIIFGVLGGLACLGNIQNRSGFYLSKIVLEFPNPIFAEINYTIEIKDVDLEKVTVKIYDGRRLILKAVANFEKKAVNLDSSQDTIHPDCPALESPRFEDSDFFKGRLVEGIYSPSWVKLREIVKRFDLENKGVHEIQVAALMWCSYFSGMKLPGCRSLCSRISLNFENSWNGNTSQLSYRGEVMTFDRRFELLKVEAKLSIKGIPLANGEIQSFVRQNSPIITTKTLKNLLPTSELLKGKVALIIGASRGLGAAITEALAWQGCTVLVNFFKSQTAAEKLLENLSDAPGKILLLQGDASNIDWCQAMKDKITHDYGQLNFLVTNACPPPLPLRLEPNAAKRINQFLNQSVSLVSIPLTVFLGYLAENSGWNVTISSLAVKTIPHESSHYISAKCAVEGLVSAAAAEYPKVAFLVVRPPKLLTDLNNTPLGREGAISPYIVAANIVQRLMEPTGSEQIEICEEFDRF